MLRLLNKSFSFCCISSILSYNLSNELSVPDIRFEMVNAVFILYIFL